MNFNELLSPEEQSAIGVLEAGGFKAFTEARLADVRELGTGLRRRTFRNRGRYQLVLACRHLENRTRPSLSVDQDEAATEPVVDPAASILTAADLQAAYPDLCRQLLEQVARPDGVSGEDPDPVPATPPAEQKPVDEMLKEELLAEARTYPAITGENRMNKPELAAAVQAQRDRRAIVHRSFGYGR